MAKKGASENYPFYVCESSSFAHNSKLGKDDAPQPQREKDCTSVMVEECSLSERDDQDGSVGDVRHRGYFVNSGRAPRPLEPSRDPRIYSREGTSINPQSGSQSDERSLRQKICDLYNRYLYSDEFPQKLKKKIIYPTTNDAHSRSRSKSCCSERDVDDHRPATTTTPTKKQEDNKLRRPQEYLPHEPPPQFQIEFWNDHNLTSSNELDVYGHGEPILTDYEKYTMEDQDPYFPYQPDDSADSLQEFCIQDENIETKGVGWITSLMASTHFPSRWLGTMIRDFIIYFFFLACLSAVVLSSSDPTLYYYCHSVYERLLKSPFQVTGQDSLKTTRTYFEMNSISNQWSFMRDVYLPNVYISQIEDKKVKRSDKGMEMFESVLLGVPRLRQIRVKADSCEVHPELKKTFEACFDYYYSHNEETRPFGSQHQNGWTYAKDSNDGMYIGKISNYYGGGFSHIFSKDVNKARESINELNENTWIDQATRVVFLDATLYSPNINYFHFIKLVMELPPSGGVVPSAHCHTLKLLRYISYYDFFILAVELFLVVFIIYYTAQLIRELLFYGRTYIVLFWGVYDIILVLMGYSYIIFWIILTVISHMKTFELMKSSLDNSSSFPNFGYVAQLNLIFHKFSLVYLFIAYVKTIKFFSISKTCVCFSGNLKGCSMQFLSQAVLSSFTLLAFAITGHLLFGSKIREFSSVSWSFFTLFIALQYGKNDFASVSETDLILAPIFIYVFKILMVMSFMNFVIATVVHAVKCSYYDEREVVSGRMYLGEAVAGLIQSLVHRKATSKSRTRERRQQAKPLQTTQCYFTQPRPFKLSLSTNMAAV